MFEYLPLTYFIAGFLCFGIATYGALNLNKVWSTPLLAVMAMYAMWYILEPIYYPDEFASFSQTLIFDAYYYSVVFILTFSLFFVLLRPVFSPRHSLNAAGQQVSLTNYSRDVSALVARFTLPLAICWVVLVAIGSLRLGGNVFAALFPLEGRAGVVMWQRAAGADAGAAGFMVSTGAYLYLMISAFLGALLPLASTPRNRLVLLALVCLAWPYHFLQGSRNETLVASLPCIISFLMFSKFSRGFKTGVILVVAMFFNFWFGVVIQMRQEQVAITEISLSGDTKHLGLNMASELCWTLYFQASGILEPSWGMRYIAEVLNIVPRALWPGKPLIGIDYAIARGFGSTETDIGVFATISTGVIGQGIANFGPFFGAAFVGFAMACWANLLSRFLQQGSLPRLLLFVLGLGLTINLGRDITLLTLFPFIFGYLTVRAFEYREMRRNARSPSSRFSRRSGRSSRVAG